MKNFIFIATMLAVGNGVFAQPVPKRVVAEHFTNTYCSVCASRNPGLYTTLASQPDVIHISYFPSSPYAAGPINKYNKIENDWRTNYYGLYGSTPKLVVQGKYVTAPFTDAGIFTSQAGTTSSFDVRASISPVGSDSAEVRVVVKMVDTSSLPSQELFVAIVEDTLLFNANNGETKHYDVFRKAVWGTAPLYIPALLSPGDSGEFFRTIPVDAAWPRQRIHAVAILQQSDKQVLQAAKSAKLVLPSSIPNVSNRGLILYPNPATDQLTIEGISKDAILTVIGMRGAIVLRPQTTSFDVASLVPGVYCLLINDAGAIVTHRFVKQ